LDKSFVVTQYEAFVLDAKFEYFLECKNVMSPFSAEAKSLTSLTTSVSEKLFTLISNNEP
jgi:hypothetical protein